MCSAIRWPAFLWATLCVSCLTSRLTAADARPNILFIIVDDQSPAYAKSWLDAERTKWETIIQEAGIRAD